MVTSVLHILKIVVRECCYVYVCASMYNLFIFNSSTNQWMTRIFICFSLLGSSSLEEKKNSLKNIFDYVVNASFGIFVPFQDVFRICIFFKKRKEKKTCKLYNRCPF